MTKRGISIIIPTRNGGPRFAELLGRLARQRVDGPVELIVLDSESTDATAAAARQAGARVETVERRHFNHGATRNRGIRLSSGAIIVLLSQDAMPADDSLLARLCGNFADPRVAGAFARQEPRPEHGLVVGRSVREWSGAMVRQESVIVDRPAYDRLGPLERLAFCRFDNVCSAIRRSVWERLPFAPRDFAEDLDWSKRALEGGWKIIYDPAACVVHSHGLSLWAHYRRYYQTHRALRELFGLELVPSRREVARQWCLQSVSEVKWLWRNEPVIARRLWCAGAVPARMLATVLGTHRGARSVYGIGAKLPTSSPTEDDHDDRSKERPACEGGITSAEQETPPDAGPAGRL